MAGSAAVHRPSFLPPPSFSSAAALNLPRLPSSSTAASLSPFTPYFLCTTHLPCPFFLLPVVIADVAADLLAFSVLGRRRSFAVLCSLFSVTAVASLSSAASQLLSRRRSLPPPLFSLSSPVSTISLLPSPPSPVGLFPSSPTPIAAVRRRFSPPPRRPHPTARKPHLHPFLLFLLLCIFSPSVTMIRTPSASPSPSSSAPALANVAASLFSSAVASSLRLPLLSPGSDNGKEKALLLLLH